MIMLEWITVLLLLIGGFLIVSAFPLWIIGHLFMIDRIDRVILGKSLKGSFDDNLWMINQRIARYSAFAVLHKRSFYRKIASYGTNVDKRMERSKLYHFFPKTLSGNLLDHENKLEKLSLFQKIFLYGCFWGLTFGFCLMVISLFLNKVCGIPFPS